MTATVDVRNTGGRDGTEIVQVWAEQPVTHEVVIAPRRRLVGFARVDVAAGQSRQVSIPIHRGALWRTPGDIQSVARPGLQPGTYRLVVNDLHPEVDITR